MRPTIHFFLEESGEIEDTSYLDFMPGFSEPEEYGLAVSSKLDSLDQRADYLDIRRVSSFIQDTVERDNSPIWQGYVEGLATFESLLNDLLCQLGTNDKLVDIGDLVWDLRVCELILRKAELDCENFYICYA